MNIENTEILAPKLPLSVLLIEDNPDDVALCLRVLRKAQLDVCCDVVAHQHEFLGKLAEMEYDVVLADYNLGPWTGMDALQLMQDRGYDRPFILVTGALGEQKAVECFKKGIADYILKDRLERLPMAILRAVEDRGLYAERDRMQCALRENEAKFRTLADAIPIAIFIEEGTRCCYVNRAAEKITGYNREELLSSYFWQLLLPDSRDAALQQTIEGFQKEESTRRYEIEILTKRNEVKALDVTVKVFPVEGRLAHLITAFEIARPGTYPGKSYIKKQSNLHSAGSGTFPSSQLRVVALPRNTL